MRGEAAHLRQARKSRPRAVRQLPRDRGARADRRLHRAQAAGAQDAPPRRLPPRAGAPRQQRLPDHRLRGRAVAPALRDAAQALAAARRGRHAALVQLRQMERASARPGPRTRPRSTPGKPTCGARSSPLMPTRRRAAGSIRVFDDVRGLLELFELEKVLYELRYEIDNRPDWVRIPLSGLAALTAKLNGGADMNRFDWCSSRCAACSCASGRFPAAPRPRAPGHRPRLDFIAKAVQLRHREGPARGELQRADRARRASTASCATAASAPTAPRSSACSSTGW